MTHRVFRRKTALVLLITVLVLLMTVTGYCLIRGMYPLALLHDPVEQNTYTTVIYKTIQNQALELHIYQPTRRLFRLSPVVVYLHGGSWKGGSHRLKQDELDGIFNPMRDLGMCVVSVAYRLTDDQTKYPAHLEDVVDAINYLIQHADDFSIDQDRLCTLGASAGAHLALMAAMTGPDAGKETPVAAEDSWIRCVVGISSPLDFVDLSCYEGEDLVRVQALLADFLGRSYEADPDLYAAASPISYLDRDLPPILLIHGEKDQVVPVIQADTFYERSRQAGMKIRYIRVTHGDHGLKPANGGQTEPDMKTVVIRMLLFLLQKQIL